MDADPKRLSLRSFGKHNLPSDVSAIECVRAAEYERRAGVQSDARETSGCLPPHGFSVCSRKIGGMIPAVRSVCMGVVMALTADGVGHSQTTAITADAPVTFLQCDVTSDGLIGAAPKT